MGSESSKYAEGFRDLIERFLRRDIEPHLFEQQFLDMFKKEPADLDEDVFQVLGRLFGDVDAFCADPSLSVKPPTGSPKKDSANTVPRPSHSSRFCCEAVSIVGAFAHSAKAG